MPTKFVCVMEDPLKSHPIILLPEKIEYLLFIPLKRQFSKRQKSKKLVMNVQAEKSMSLKVHHAMFDETNPFLGSVKFSNSAPVMERSITSESPRREARQLL